MGIIRKHWVAAFVLLLLIPVVLILGGALFSVINPEIAAGHPNYVRNFQLLNLLKKIVMLGTAAAVVALWLLVCLQVIRAKKRSSAWLVLAAFGPFGLAVLAMLNDRTAAEPDRYSRFVRSLNWPVRVGYELCSLVIAWVLAYEGMVLKRTLMIWYEAVTTGSSVAQVTDLHNASGGMWAFAEGSEVMFLVILLYLVRPVVFNIVGHVAATMASPKAS